MTHKLRRGSSDSAQRLEKALAAIHQGSRERLQLLLEFGPHEERVALLLRMLRGLDEFVIQGRLACLIHESRTQCVKFCEPARASAMALTLPQ